METITIGFSRQEALKLGLLICECGHRPNNHFDWDDKPCAQCKCESYREKAVGKGKIVGKEQNE